MKGGHEMLDPIGGSSHLYFSVYGSSRRLRAKSTSSLSSTMSIFPNLLTSSISSIHLNSGSKDMDKSHVLCVRLRTNFVRICTLNE